MRKQRKRGPKGPRFLWHRQFFLSGCLAPRVHNDDARTEGGGQCLEPPEVRSVERQQVRDAVDEHDGHEARIMDLLARYALGGDQFRAR